MYIKKKEKKIINNKDLYYRKKIKQIKKKIKYGSVQYAKLLAYEKKYLIGYLDILSKDFEKSISLIKKYCKMKINIIMGVKK